MPWASPDRRTRTSLPLAYFAVDAPYRPTCPRGWSAGGPATALAKSGTCADTSVMFIVFGFRMRPSKVSEGEFFCTRCGADRHYVLQRFRQWFTLFFLPVFPTSGPKGEQVKCQTCGTAFRPEVLQAPTSASLTDTIRGAMRAAAVAMLNAGNPSDLASRQTVVATVATTGTVGYDDADLSEDLLRQDPSQLAAHVSQLARGLNGQGRETFITRLAEIAAADGPVSDGERAVLESVGSGLGLSAAHLLGIITSVVNSPRS